MSVRFWVIFPLVDVRYFILRLRFDHYVGRLLLGFVTVSGMVGATWTTAGVHAGGYVGDRTEKQQARRAMEKLPGVVLFTFFVIFHTIAV